MPASTPCSASSCQSASLRSASSAPSTGRCSWTQPWRSWPLVSRRWRCTVLRLSRDVSSRWRTGTCVSSRTASTRKLWRWTGSVRKSSRSRSGNRPRPSALQRRSAARCRRRSTGRRRRSGSLRSGGDGRRRLWRLRTPRRSRGSRCACPLGSGCSGHSGRQLHWRMCTLGLTPSRTYPRTRGKVLRYLQSSRSRRAFPRVT
mmetsp:Transcript_127408/g.271614  ORF Transcript_127408/g.271614 Transcript_127408/m.271614 type:complete len:202 (-) Transcript_127408:198-803(-)